MASLNRSIKMSCLLVNLSPSTLFLRTAKAWTVAMVCLPVPDFENPWADRYLLCENTPQPKVSENASQIYIVSILWSITSFLSCTDPTLYLPLWLSVLSGILGVPFPSYLYSGLDKD